MTGLAIPSIGRDINKHYVKRPIVRDNINRTRNFSPIAYAIRCHSLAAFVPSFRGEFGRVADVTLLARSRV